MPKLLQLSIVMPAYLEAENLKILLPQIKATLDELKITYEVIVVDTTSGMDDTSDVCTVLDIVYLNRSPDNSFGSAVRSGIKRALGEKIIFMDSDGSHSPSFIPKLYMNSTDYDIVIASRYVDSGATDNPWYLVWMSKALNYSFALVLGVPCKDISNSFKIYESEDIKGLNLSCDNFDIVEEIIFKAYKKNKDIKILEVPYFFKKRIHGETKRNLFLFILTYFYTIIKLRFFV